MPTAKKTSTSSPGARPKRVRRDAVSTVSAPTVTAAEIARRAYEIYESRGRVHGAHLDQLQNAAE